MKTYHKFHGDIPAKDIGMSLRAIVKTESKNFKILTGFGATTGMSNSKKSALKSLNKMKKEGLIKGYLPGEVKHQIISESQPFYEDMITFASMIKNDPDFGNDGIIFIFVK